MLGMSWVRQGKRVGKRRPVLAVGAKRLAPMLMQLFDVNLLQLARADGLQ